MMLRTILTALVISTVPVVAQERWTATELTNTTLPAEIVRETRAPAPGGIPHMLTATASGEPGRDVSIARAWYAQPTSRYGHGVLGDRIEGGALVVGLSNGRQVSYRLDETLVFEDIAPRIADLDGDGAYEVVTILSHLRQGAAVAIFALSGDVLVKRAQTPFIGRANRWLNIAAIDHFSGGNTPDIAFVATPHIGGKLGFLKYLRNTVLLFATDAGYSNHVIGSPELRLSASADIDGDSRPELALPSADRSTLRIVGFTTNGLKELARASLPGRIDKAILAAGSGNDASFTVGLEDGRIFKISR